MNLSNLSNLTPERRYRILEEITRRQQKDIETSSLIVEYTIRYQKYAFKFLPPCYIKYNNLFITYCKRKYVGLWNRADVDGLFELFIRSFKNWCDEIVEDKGMSELERMENETDEIDKIFIRLVRMLNVVSWYKTKLANWSVKEIASNVLCHMYEYYTINWQPGKTIEEDLIQCLLIE